MSELVRQACDLSVVIPLYREGVHLGDTVKEISQVLEGLETRYELILVDDGSPDDTWQAILTQAKHNPAIKGLRLSRNFGKEAALAAGLEQASGKAIVVMDGDLQHPPTLIPTMLQCWRDGAEVVEAVKQHRGKESLRNRIQAQVFYRTFALLAGYDLRGASDFKLIDRRVLEAWRHMGERNLFFRGMSAWLGFRRVQLPFDVPERAGGQSTWSVLQLTRLAMTAVTSFSSAPLHLITLAGMGFMLFSLILGMQTIYLKLAGKAVDGFTTVILLLLIIGGAVMLGLGIIGTYVARIYEEVKGRPRYIIAEQVKQ
ncbi:glycosyltransferase family 2 protein [Chitinimonas sp. JJ19]|uniref:glycosyltransferase family 2 protein n=1 Tax=Chitinimonas sp. JJ19 TaxID=3109352 RepID=UPI0030013021